MMKTGRSAPYLAATFAVAALALGLAASPAWASLSFSLLPGEMSEARYTPAAATLPSGKVLVAGGYDGSTRVRSAELFDPATGTFEALSAKLGVERGEAGFVTLPSGQVLLAGGYNEKEFNLKSAELFDPNTDTFETISELTSERDGPAAALLHNGKVLIVGGYSGGKELNSAELYDPATKTFEALSAKMGEPRYLPVAATLPNGNVLIAGGYNETGGGRSLTSAEVFNPGSGTFEALAAKMAIARDEEAFSALPDGAVLIAGGWNSVETNLKSAELFNPSTGNFETLPNLNVERDGPAAALLQDGRVLIVGGYGKLGGVGEETWLKSAELASFGAPGAATGVASSVGTTSATFNGTAVSEVLGHAYFQYGTSTAYGASTAVQGVAAGLAMSPVSAPVSGLTPGATYHFRLVAENAAGVTYGADQSFTTAAPPIAAPTIANARQSASRWREGTSLARISRKHKAPLGTTFSLTLNASATVTFKFTHSVTGRRAGHKCVRKTRRNAKHRKCKRTITAGTLTFAGHAGINKVTFQGRVSPSKKLRPGRYTLLITASNSSGHAGPVRLNFTIVK
jgi:hypothetical protein